MEKALFNYSDKRHIPLSVNKWYGIKKEWKQILMKIFPVCLTISYYFKLFSIKPKDFNKGFRLVTILLLTGISFPLLSQNLISNPSFEEKYDCPIGNDLNNGQLELAKGWWKPTLGTSDYFNRCNKNVVSIPVNFWGYQEAFHGDGYIGIGPVSWYKHNMSFAGFEYVQTRLNSDLKKCHTYYFSMYINCANYSQYGVGRIGTLFTSDSLSISTDHAIESQPQIINQNGFLLDTLSWVKVDGTFKSIGTERYLTLGYFFNEIKSDTIFIQEFPGTSDFASYYYIDSVSLYDLGIIEPCEIVIPKVFSPNGDGINDFFGAAFLNQFDVYSVRIFNRWGMEVQHLTPENPVWNGKNKNGADCPEGVYYYVYTGLNVRGEVNGKGFVQLFR